MIFSASIPFRRGHVPARRRSPWATLPAALVAAVLLSVFGCKRFISSGNDMREALAKYEQGAEARLKPRFERAGVPYPPEALAFLAFKAEKRFELWASAKGRWKLVHTYKVKAASGVSGPKLREGDEQVPEGIYKVVVFNPKSKFHLSMGLNYPNEFDLKYARKESRDEPGSDIYIHGRAASIGCLAMGDPAIEELFVLAAKTGKEKIKVVIAPHDMRIAPARTPAVNRPWVPELYANIQRELKPFAVGRVGR